MQVNDLTSIDPNVDFTQILPIQQKRTIAFFNHFVTNTVSFLNTFSQSCESRLMEFENKLQKIESSLMILEAQLSSISGLEDEDQSIKKTTTEIQPNLDLPEIKSDDSDVKSELPAEEKVVDGVRASQHPLYQKFFKMVQFGVPSQAVKNKMRIEGVNPDMLDSPEMIISDDTI